MSKKTSLLQCLMRTGRFAKAFDAEQAIRNGNVSVNNKRVENPRFFLNQKTAVISVGGQLAKPVRKLYFLFNKPRDVICQKSPEEQTIYGFFDSLSLTREEKSSLFAVGRLDKDTEGLLIITNDGELSNMLMRPEASVPKTYSVVAQRPLSHKDVTQLQAGIAISVEHEKYMTSPCAIRKTGNSTFLMTITEGKKNQIKLMLGAVGNEVAYLKRLSVGDLELGSIASGDLRQTTRETLLSACRGGDKNP